MQTFTEFTQVTEAIGEKQTVATIGVFDGLHLGHQALIGAAVSLAQQGGNLSLVITFPDHPLATLAPPYCPKKLIYADTRSRLLEGLGVDLVAEISFTERFASWEPQAFIEQVLVRQCRVGSVVCGYDFSFGRAGSGNFEVLREAGERLGFEVAVVSAIEHDGVLVKSTQIRDLLFSGNVEGAAQLLTRPYELRGTVVRGFQRGRTIGYPTANLEAGEQHVVPAVGVYVCAARVLDDSQAVYGAMVNIGHNPTFDVGHLRIEAHLLDFSRELEGKAVALHFLRRLREERKFSGVDALVGQLKLDEAESRSFLGSGEGAELFGRMG